jgi:hypothetical protein
MRRDRLVTHELRLTGADMMLRLRNVKDHLDAALKFGAKVALGGKPAFEPGFRDFADEADGV